MSMLCSHSNGKLALVFSLVVFTALPVQAGLTYPQTKAIQTARRSLNNLQNVGQRATNAADVQKQIGQIDGVLGSLKALKIPATEKQYVDLMARAEEIRKSLQAKLAALGGGSPEPASKPATEPETGKPEDSTPKEQTPAAKPVKLRYDQEKKLKDAKYHLSKASGSLKYLLKAQKELKAGTLTDARTMEARLRDTDACLNSIKNAENHLAGLPEAHPDVAKYKGYLPRWREALGGIKSDFTAAVVGAKAAVDMKNFPNYAADRERLEMLAKAYNTSGPFDTRPAESAELWKRLPDNVAFGDRCLQIYKPLIDARTSAGTGIVVKHKWFAKNVKAYQQAIESWARSAPATCEATLQKALSMGEKAAKEKKPAFFAGGVQQQMERARKMLTVLKANPKGFAGLANLETRYKTTQSQLDQLASTLKEQILASVKAPANRYQGGDAAKLKGMIQTAWKKAFPKEQILGIHFHKAEWIDEKGVRWDKGYKRWERYDRSTLPARVAIKTDDRIATLYMAFINRNNLKNTLNAGVHTRDAYVVEEMLLSNYK